MAEKFSREKMEALFSGKKYGRVTIGRFLREDGKVTKSHRSRWVVTATCGYCGHVFEDFFDNIRHKQNPSCGCQNRVSSWNRSRELDRMEGSARAKRREEREAAAKAKVTVFAEPVTAQLPEKTVEPPVAVENPQSKATAPDPQAQHASLYVKVERGDCIGDGVELTLSRLHKLWELLDKADCCKAWQENSKSFCLWGIRNGYARGKALVKRDNAKPWHPLNCRWEIK